jgi:hypothetical protein
MSGGMKWSFIALGVLALIAALVMVVAGASPILSSAAAVCGGTAFAYVWRRERGDLR